MLDHTLILIAITCVISFAAFSNKHLEDALIFWSPAVKKGQVHRLITSGFIHADTGHLLFNMITLYFFGTAIENIFRSYLGEFGFVGFYALAIVVAILPTFISNYSNPRYRSLGASGGVCAVLFAYILIAPWSMLYIFFAIPIPAIVFAFLYVGYSIWAQAKRNDNTNHSAHIWGAVFGVVATAVMEPNVLTHFLVKLLSPPF